MAKAPKKFETAYREHLTDAQRRHVLETMQRTLQRETTLGEIVDAAAELGWGDAMNELTLSDLARSLLDGEARLRADAIDEDAEAVFGDDVIEERVTATPPARAKKKTAAKKKPAAKKKTAAKKKRAR